MEIVIQYASGKTVSITMSIDPGAGATLTPNSYISWGDGLESLLLGNPNPTHTYASYGTYNITLYVENSCGGTCSDTHSITLVDPCAGITCPNVCNGVDLWSQKCVDGVCTDKALIESNSSSCGYCPGVTTTLTLVSQNDLTVVVDVQTSPSTGWKPDDPHLDWGDGKGHISISNGHHTHTYASAGRYNIQLGGGLTCGNANSDYIYVDVTAPCPVPTCSFTID